MKNPSMSAEQASTLLRQLGGQGRLTAMIGAKDFLRSSDTDGTPALSFKFPGSPRANYARIVLDPNDTYTLKLFKVRGLNANLVGVWADLYAENLKSAFEQATGLYLSLGTMRGNPAAGLPRWSKRVDAVPRHSYVLVKLADGRTLIADRYPSRKQYASSEWEDYVTGESIPKPVAWRKATEAEQRATLVQAEAHFARTKARSNPGRSRRGGVK